MDGSVGVLERNLGETVFRDLHLSARLLHLLTQNLHLGDGEAGIVSHHHDVRGLEDPAQFGDGLRFCRSIHCKLFPVMTARRMSQEPPGCYQPSRFLSSRAANRAGRRSSKPAPRNMTFGHEPGIRGSNQLGAAVRLRKLGSLPRLCWPFVARPASQAGRIKRRLRPRRRQSWTGRSAPFAEPALRAFQSNEIGLSLSDVPPGCPKGIVSNHH